MIPPTSNRSVVTGSAQDSASFEISVKDSAHIMGILRDTLYTDKILAVLREYSANAWDAHRSVGKHDVPISVTLPTRYEPTLRIRDFGPGLSHDDVFNVYTQYGASTKRGSDDVVGMLGIGSKSGFAYADSFTIISWHGNFRRTYVAVLDESEKGAINLLDTQLCSPDETGVEIQITVKNEDVYSFERTARRLFQHFRPRPTINIDLPAEPEEQTVLTHGIITPNSADGWIAVMGCVPYRINLDALDPREVSRCLPNLSGQLSFNIGEVQVNASREELKYSTATKKALVEKFNALVDEFVLHALQQLESGVLDGWQTRLRVQVLARLDLPLPDQWKSLAEGFAKVTYTHDDFIILHNNAVCTRLTVDKNTTLLIDDTGLALTGYYFNHNDYVVRGTGKTPDEVRALLDAALTASKLTGVTIGLLSGRHWTAPVVPVKRKANPKHRARMFVLKPAKSFAAPWSDYWEPQLRVPTSDDVFVLISGFRADDYKEFFSDYRKDAELAEAFGVTMPSVYGYKTTEKKPTLESACSGTHYRAWREKFIQSLLTPDNIELIATYWRANVTGDTYDMRLPDAKRRAWLANELGDDHPLVQLCVDAATASDTLQRSMHSAIVELARRGGHTFAKSVACATIEDLKARYPLLRRVGFRSVWGSSSYYDDPAHAKAERADWLDYVRMCDERHAKATQPNNVVHLVSVP